MFFAHVAYQFLQLASSMASDVIMLMVSLTVAYCSKQACLDAVAKSGLDNHVSVQN